MKNAALRELFTNNYWARDRQLEACAALSGEEFLRPMGNSFASIRDTLAHLVDVEWIWLERWCGRSPVAMPAPGRYATLDVVRERWREIERDMWHYVDGLDEGSLDRLLTYRNFKGEVWAYTLRQMLVHLMLHQSYHRGQVTTMLRQLGKPAPQVDYLLGIDMEFRPS